jgi:hypothetical protein
MSPDRTDGEMPLRYLFAASLATTLLTAGVRVGPFETQVRTFYSVKDALPSNDIQSVAILDGQLLASTAAGVVTFHNGKWTRGGAFPSAPVVSGLSDVRQLATHPDGRMAAATATGLYLKETSGGWTPLFPQEGNRSWAPHDVRGVAFDTRGRLWFASPQGVGCFDGGWRLYTGLEGLPYDDFTTVAAGENGVIWFGTHRGAIRFDGITWEYRQGLRWLPDDDVRSIAIDSKGNAWFATSNGVGLIARRPTTLASMATHFEGEIDKRHRRTQFQYVDSVTLDETGDLSKWTQHDSDNDGLWTAMYGAGECFAYAATGDPLAKKRAETAFAALRFLGQVTQGGNPPAAKGFVARSILPTSGPNPNVIRDTPERDRQMQATRDKSWKILTPRWPISADGKWYWKADTSSDELDGHYFFYANYYDLVANTPEEKARVREHVAALTDHLIDHGFQLVDHDGKVTRWGVFNPEQLNHVGVWWEERSLNSLSMLSYLRTAEHITGDTKYGRAARELVEKHGYATNVAIAKTNAGPGSGNQSDDEMAFMNFYCLLKYETDPVVRQIVGLAFFRRWTMEKFELNPLFNFLYAGSAPTVKPEGDWLNESIDTLKRYPMDRVNWALENSHRKDIALLPEYARGSSKRGSRRDGRVLPIDERYVDKWNHDPWALDSRGNGRKLADGASFLLPYYLGLYLKFID